MQRNLMRTIEKGREKTVRVNLFGSFLLTVNLFHNVLENQCLVEKIVWNFVAE